MKKLLKIGLLLSFAGTISVPPLDAQSIEKRYTEICPFLSDSNYVEETIGGVKYFKYALRDNIISNPSGIDGKDYRYILPIPDSVLVTTNLTAFDVDEKDKDNIAELKGFYNRHLKTYTITLSPNKVRASFIRADWCDAARLTKEITTDYIKARVCGVGEEDRTFQKMFYDKQRELFGLGGGVDPASGETDNGQELSGWGMSGNVRAGLIDTSNAGSADITMDLFKQAIDKLTSKITEADISQSQFCDIGVYDDMGGNKVASFCEPATGMISEDAIAAGIEEFANLETACRWAVDFRMRVGESYQVINVESINSTIENYGATIGFATLRCELNPSTGVASLTSVPNDDGACNPSDIELYEAGSGLSGCNKQLCLFTGRGACPATELRWTGGDSADVYDSDSYTDDQNPCRVLLPFGLHETELNSVANENPSREGSASFICLAKNTRNPRWVLNGYEPPPTCVDKAG